MKKTSTLKKSTGDKTMDFSDISETTSAFWDNAEVRAPVEVSGQRFTKSHQSLFLSPEPVHRPANFPA